MTDTMCDGENQALRDRLARLEPLERLLSYVPGNVIMEVVAVLDHGEAKHPDGGWKNHASIEHVDAANGHIRSAFNYGPGLSCYNLIEDESGHYHLAHAICRLMFALGKVME